MKLSGQRRMRILVSVSSFLIMASLVYGLLDYMGPAKIPLRYDTGFGMPCLKARDLIVQEYDLAGNLWATRGMVAYYLEPGDSVFRKEAHIPTGISIFWLRNFSLLRRITVRPECVEMVTGSNGQICALSAGKMWYYDREIKKFAKTMTISHYGFGDQGARNNGILRANDSTIYFGEYFQNFEMTEVHIYESSDNGKSWDIVHTFPPGAIRHIHAIQKDPYTGRLWLCTGDNDNECLVAYSDDGFRTIIKAGAGGQEWRVCQLVFAEDGIYWGTDTSDGGDAGLYKMSRENGMLSKLLPIKDMIFFGTRLENGMMVISSNRQGSEIENDELTRFYFINPDGRVVVSNAGTWNFNDPGFRFKYAQLRFQRNQGSTKLAVTVLNQKEFTDGDLLIIDQTSLGRKSAAGSIPVMALGE